MRRLLSLVALAPVAMLVSAHPAVAGEPVFANAPITDNTLADINGAGSWYLSRANLAGLSDSESSRYLQWSGKVARTQMDVWWGTTGSELIAQSVRSAGFGGAD